MNRIFMRNFCVLAAFAIAAPVFVAGCASSDEGVEDSSDDDLTKAAVRLKAADDGKSVEIEVGQKLIVELASNPTTGYEWSAIYPKPLGAPVEKFVSGNGALGSGGKQRFTWTGAQTATTAGTMTVRLQYKRSWEKKPAADTFTFKVKVNPKKVICPLGMPAPPTCKSGEQPYATKNAQGCFGGWKCVSCPELDAPPPGYCGGNYTTVTSSDTGCVVGLQCRAQDGCKVSGCSGQVCGELSIVTTCEWKPEYEKFKQPGVVCKKTAGACGWSFPSP